MRKILIFILLLTLTIVSIPSEVNARMRIHYNTPYEKWPNRLKGAQDDMTVEIGYIDVTREPYNAIGDGVIDDTIALKKAINDAYIANLGIYLPADKVFLVTDTLLLKSTDPSSLNLGINTTSSRKFANMVYGGTDGARPIIKLKDGTSLSSYTSVLHFESWDATKSGSLYASTVKNVHIDLGDNPEWSGFSMDGAQICSMSQVSVSGVDFFAGLKNIPGNGTNLSNIVVEGGDYGIFQNAKRPSITMEDILLRNQNIAGFYLGSSKGGTSLTGFEIVNDSPNADYIGIKLSKEWNRSVGPTVSSITLKDGVIDAGIGTGLLSEQSMFYIENVYIKANTIFNHGSLALVNSNNLEDWNLINEYAYADGEEHASYYNEDDSGVINKVSLSDEVIVSEIEYGVIPSINGENLRKKHSYDSSVFPTIDDDYVSIIEYGATRDDSTDDDAGPIQAAIDDVTNPSSLNYLKAVFIPRGHFHIRSSILLKSGLKMFGAAKTNSVLHFDHRWDIDSFTVGIDTEDDADGSLVLSEFAILGLRTDTTNDIHLGGYSNNSHKYMTLFRWRTNNSYIRDLQITRVEGGGDTSEYYEAPMNLITGNAGGKVYGTFAYDTGTFTDQGNLKGDFRIHMFLDTHNPISIYGINGVHSFQRSDGANVEVRGCENLDLYSFKTESVNSFLRIVDSNNINIYGKSGTSYVDDKYVQSNVLIYNSNNIKITNYSDDGLTGLFGPHEIDSYTLRHFENDGSNHSVSHETDPILLYKYSKTDHTTSNLKINLLDGVIFDDKLDDLSSTATLKLTNSHIYQGKYAYHIDERNDDLDTIEVNITQLFNNLDTIDHTFSAKFKTDFGGFSDLPQTMYMRLKLKLNDNSEEIIDLGDITLQEEENSKQESEGKLLNHWFKIMGSVDQSYSGIIEEAHITFEFTHSITDLYFDDFVVTEGDVSWPHMADLSNYSEYNLTDFVIPVCNNNQKLINFHCTDNIDEEPNPVCSDGQEIIDGECLDIIEEPKDLDDSGCFGSIGSGNLVIAIMSVFGGLIIYLKKFK